MAEPDDISWPPRSKETFGGYPDFGRYWRDAMPGPDDRVDDPHDEMTERMALGQTRGDLREPGPDDRGGTEWETGEP